jgi:hypothetical protein
VDFITESGVNNQPRRLWEDLHRKCLGLGEEDTLGSGTCRAWYLESRRDCSGV